MIAAIPSAILLGVEARPVSVEVHVSNGLPGFTIVGLPDAAVRESRDRVRAALLSSSLPWPQRRTTVNLAPSGVRKAGAGLDLPIAVGVLVASGALPPSAVAGMAFCGELGLDGSLHAVGGAMALREAVAPLHIVLPACVSGEAAMGEGGEVRAATTLAALVDQLCGRRPWPPPLPADGAGDGRSASHAGPGGPMGHHGTAGDLADVRGQRLARRALEVAAAGGHHLLLVGPPGAGKSMLAVRLPGVLPDLDRGQAIEAARIRSAAGLPPAGGGRLPVRPPFRAPHHGASAVSVIGGGSPRLRPGEVSLAHGGVLFLDELGEFPPAVLDALRQPLEEGVVRVSRARGTVEYPARFLLVAAMNPCPCGQRGGPGTCRCGSATRARYARRVSGPLLDRIDVAVRVDRPDVGELLGHEVPEGTAVVAARVAAARRRAEARGVASNSELGAEALDRWAPLHGAARRLVERRLREGSLSARGYRRVQRVALTLADLAGEDEVGPGHVGEALVLRGGRSWLDEEAGG
ncbi:MAG TPA: YifB family Mg chelatase-like AAA ATPase [Acidimicrobiales bacterium]|nr:YifB family Mg chelatase-like AAA ATPase [Acidimicrobiales bacterium]